MSKFIWIGKDRVPVSDEIYREYYQMKRRERYLENDIKAGQIKVDTEKEEVTFVESKEDSIQRLMDLGADFADDQLVEDVVCDKAMLFILQEAMAELNQEEQELIQAIFYKNHSVREVAQQKSISHVAVLKRRDKILDKLRKFFK